MLGRLKATRKTGQEPFIDSGTPLRFTLADFWGWSASDLVSNAMRGVLAEFIVGQAVGADVSGVREEWASYDLQTPEGTKVEVKSAAYLQGWSQRRLSAISFRTPRATSWDASTGEIGSEAKRHADVYVFALLAHQDKATLNPMDMSQWRFYVLPTAVLNARTRSQHSITLRSLEALAGAGLRFDQLRDVICAFTPPPTPSTGRVDLP